MRIQLIAKAVERLNVATIELIQERSAIITDLIAIAPASILTAGMEKLIVGKIAIHHCKAHVAINVNH